MGQKIYENYVRCCNTPSDINEHIPTLKSLADECGVILELGTRFVCSSWAFLMSNAKEVYSVDLNYNNFIKEAEQICKNEQRHWKFILDSSLTLDPPKNLSLIFFDTFHSFSNLRQELNKFGNLSSKYLVFHDSVSWARQSENFAPKGVMDAIEEFLESNKKCWKEKAHYLNNNGLYVMERIS